MTSKFSNITVNKARALLDVSEGADVYSLATAQLLREVQREHPSLISIVPAQNAPEEGHLVQPYFGAQATELGVLVAEHRLQELVGPSNGFTLLECRLLDLIEDLDEILKTALVGHHDLVVRVREFAVKYRPQKSFKGKLNDLP